MNGLATGVQRGVPITTTIASLLLDAHNPRLPESLQGGDQIDLAVVLEIGFDAFSVAQSIADNGYFAGEPLIAIRSDFRSDSEEPSYVVVEGNRRLTALFGLAYREIREEFVDPEKWEAVALKANITPSTLVPVVVHESRAATHAEVSRAHVVGKLAWRPFMQARFIASRVAEGMTISEVADLIGITKSKAADLYRDQAIAAQAQRVGLETSEVEKAFSVLTVAMSNTKLRDHISAPLGSRLEPGTDPVPENKVGELKELISWVFGYEDAEPVITDSRQMSKLGTVVASDVGLAALRAGKSLEEASQQVQSTGLSPLDRLSNRLNTAMRSLNAASEDLAEHVSDPRIRELLSDLESVFESLRSVWDQSETDGDPSWR